MTPIADAPRNKTVHDAATAVAATENAAAAVAHRSPPDDRGAAASAPLAT